MSNSQSSLVQSAYYGAYFLLALPAGFINNRYGYKAGVLTGLGLAAAGGLLFLPASQFLVYEMFLLALFVLAAGLSILETSANPLSSPWVRIRQAPNGSISPRPSQPDRRQYRGADGGGADPASADTRAQQVNLTPPQSAGSSIDSGAPCMARQGKSDMPCHALSCHVICAL